MEAAIHQSDYELERGKPMPNLTHGSIQANLSFELKSRYRSRFRVASEVTLNTEPVGSTPDVLLYPPSHLKLIDELAKRPDAPILTIEIQSPSQSMEEMVEKVNRYFAFGTKSCWIVVPSLQAVLVYDQPDHYRFFHEQDVLVDSVVDIELPLASVFE